LKPASLHSEQPETVSLIEARGLVELSVADDGEDMHWTEGETRVTPPSRVRVPRGGDCGYPQYGSGTGLVQEKNDNWLKEAADFIPFCGGGGRNPPIFTGFSFTRTIRYVNC
jgi:hypothetical protein